MTIEDQITEINKLMSDHGNQIYSGGSPDLHALQNKIAQFVTGLQALPIKRAIEYSHIIDVWSTELRKMSEKLSFTKNQVQQEFNRAQGQGRAANAYMSAKKFE